MKIMKRVMLVIAILTSISSIKSQVNTSQYQNVVNFGSKTVFKDGVSKVYYLENGVSVTASLSTINTYGKYYQVNLEIENFTGKDFTFFPNQLVGFLTKYQKDKKTGVVSLKGQEKAVFLSSDEYLQKVNNRQAWATAITNLALNQRAQSAGYSSSVTTTAVAGTSNSYGSARDYYNNRIDVKAKTNYSGVGVSATQSYDGNAAYQAQKDVDKTMQDYNEQLYQIKSVLNQGYMKANTIENRQRITGYVNIKYENADKLELLVPVNGKYYSFIFGYNPDNSNSGSMSEEDISDNPEVNRLYKEARGFVVNKNLDEYAKSITKAIALDPNNYKLYDARANGYFGDATKSDLILNDLGMTIKLNPSKETYYKRAAYYVSIKKYNEAIEDANSVLTYDDKNIEAYFIKALCKSSLSDFYGSINDYEKILSLNNSNFQQNESGIIGTVYNNLGYTYLKLNDFKKSLDYINKALSIIPNHSFVWGSRGEYYYKSEEYKKCIADMNTAIDLIEKKTDRGGSMDLSVPYLYRGLAKIKLGKDKNEACSDLYKAKELGNKEAIEAFKQNCQ